jgi:hypothetical protein
LEETIIEVADIEVDLTVVVTEVDLEAEDLHSVADVVALVEATTEAPERCLKQLVATVAKTAKFLLNQPTVNQFIVVTVLKKWAMEEEVKADATITKDHKFNPLLFLALS